MNDHANTVPDEVFMYQIDAGTAQAIVSPRTYNLRKLQLEDGIDTTDLKLEQRGLAHVSYMHHVSKIIEGKAESFRVRICRSCSKMHGLMELGSYADLESALLVNDAHEILNGRYKHLHLLSERDEKYIKYINVRRRGASTDIPVLQALNDRLAKSKLADKLILEGEAERAAAIKPAVDRGSPAPEVQSLKLIADIGSKQLQADTDRSVAKRMKVSVGSSGQGTTKEVLMQPPAGRASVLGLHGEEGSGEVEDRRTRVSVAAHSSVIPVRTNASNVGTGFDGEAPSQPPGELTHPTGLNKTARLISTLDRFRTHIISVRRYLNALGLNLATNDDVAKLHEALVRVLVQDVNHMSVQASEEARVQDQSKLLFVLRDQSIPRAFLFSMLSSFFSGEVHEVWLVISKLADIIPQDSLSVSKFIEHMHVSLRAIVVLNELCHISTSTKQATITSGDEQAFHFNILPVIGFLRYLTTADTACRAMHGNELLIFNFVVFFSRLSQNAVSYYDYMIRLCVWEEQDAPDSQDVETRLQGIYGQLHIRVVALLQYLQALEVLVAYQPDSPSIGSLNFSVHFQDLFNKAVVTSAIGLQNLTTAALITWKVCRDSSIISTCFALCHTFHPLLKNCQVDQVVTQSFLRSYLSLIASSLLSSETIITASASSGSSSAPHFMTNGEIQHLAFNLGSDVLLYVQQNYWAIPYNLAGAEALLFYESALGSYVAIFILVVSLGDTDFLTTFGLDYRKLINAISTSLSGLLEWMQKLGCMVMNPNTLVSLYMLIEACSMAFIR